MIAAGRIENFDGGRRCGNSRIAHITFNVSLAAL
jgi:hypothetical protein